MEDGIGYIGRVGDRWCVVDYELGGRMTEAEFIELMYMAATVQEQYSMDFVSMVFAYVVAGHFVGASLTRIQFVVLTAIYSGFTAAIGIGALLGIRQLASLGSRFLEQHPAEAAPMIPSDNTAFLPPILLTSAWLVSIWYVASIRRAYRAQTNSSESR